MLGGSARTSAHHTPPLSVTGPAIADIEAAIGHLPSAQRRLAHRLFRVTTMSSPLVLPRQMERWARAEFHSLEAVTNQIVVRVANRTTGEETLFNSVRAGRPADPVGEPLRAGLPGDDPFCQPLRWTPEDVFGRVQGDYCLTAANLAKVDGFHGVVIFREHDPLVVDRLQLADYLRTGVRWGERVLEVDPRARYWLLWWNALWKSGASILHGHAQVTASRDVPYGRIAQLRTSTNTYRRRYGTWYFEDLIAVHDSLGLSLHLGGATLLFSLTPLKEREVWIVDPAGLTEDLLDLAYRVLRCYLDGLGVQSFNLAYIRPPLSASRESWSGFPHILRIVDRGPLDVPMADMGGLELYGCASVASDPFQLAATLGSYGQLGSSA